MVELGGDRAAERASGVSKSVWYDAKSGRAIPQHRSWPAMRSVLARLSVVGVRNWDALYDAACVEVGRPRDAPMTGPSTRPGGRVPRQLPPGTRGFVARQVELERLSALLTRADTAAVRIAVVVGLPGVGKTALALTWAHAASRLFPDGVLYVDLNGWARDRPLAADEVLPGWLQALGLEPADMPDDLAIRAACLRTALTGRRMLIVLDNAASEDQVRPLLPGSPTCAVLITSRHAMPGLAVHEGAETQGLDVLTKTESIELFRRSVGVRVDRSPAATASLVDLCGRLPLALRVVAENARSRPDVALTVLVAELASGVERLDRLESGDPRTDPRTVFSWSYQQLDTDVRAIFRRLGLYPGLTFDRYVVAALADCPLRSADRHLRTLARANLLQESGSGRFEMHGLISLYAEELLRPDEMAAARERLFRYFVFAAQQADSSVVPQRYRMGLSGDAPVTPPMGDYARALDWFDTECAAIVAMCRQDLPELDPLRWRLAFHLRGYLFLTKRTHEWVASHEAALAAAMRSGDRLGEAIIRNSLGVALLERGFDDEAMRQYETAQRLFADEGDGHGLSNALANQAVVFRQRGDFATSLRLSADALEFYRRVGAGRNVAITLRGMALSEIQLGRIAEAHKHVTESIELCAELGMDMDVAMSLNTLGEVLVLAQRYDEGERAYQGAIEMSHRCSSRYEEARALRGLGVIAVAVGQATAAQTYWQEALAIFESLGSAEADDVRVDLDRLATPP